VQQTAEQSNFINDDDSSLCDGFRQKQEKVIATLWLMNIETAAPSIRMHYQGTPANDSQTTESHLM
jgi:hypothetical protein